MIASAFSESEISIQTLFKLANQYASTNQSKVDNMSLILQKSMLKHIFIAITCALMLCVPNIALAAESPVDVQEVFTSTKTIEGDAFSYPKGKAEMRLYRVEVQAGEEIPLHSHPAPLTGHIETGQLTLKKESGKSQTFREGDSFVLGVNTPPHTMGNTGNKSAVMWVSVASAEGVPTLIPVE